jgi:Domain of unknown function (DUF4129)
MVKEDRATYIRAGAERPCGLVRSPSCENRAVHVRRLLPLGLAVAGLLALAGIASHGRPLTGSRGNGPTATFFDYVFTTVILVAVAMAVVFLVVVTSTKPKGRPKAGLRKWDLAAVLMGIVTSLALGYLLLHFHYQRPQNAAIDPGPAAGKPVLPQHAIPPNGRAAHVRWDEVLVVAFVVAVLAVALVARARRRPPGSWRLHSQESLAAALDESLDDLRNEPDLRRAIIAAYARMERTLAAAGLPRRASEAPLEYLGRALGALDGSAASVARLTQLFEWAKFSQHAPEPAMRDEAIDALVAVRDELRAPAAMAA